MKTAAKIIALAFGLFGGFLLHISPPVGLGDFINGFAQCICVLIALFILKKNAQGKVFFKKLFVLASISFVVLGFIYFFQRKSDVIVFHESETVKGLALTDTAINHCNETFGVNKFSKGQCEISCVEYYHYPWYSKDLIWKGVQLNEFKLMVLYILMVSSFIIAIFSIIDYAAEASAK